MAVIYNTQFVDEKYSAIVEPNLYFDSVLQPNVTFTDKYEERAGGIFVHKLGSGALVKPEVPAQDFTDAVTADTLIQLVFNNTFRQSEIIYGVTAASVAYNKAEAELSRLVQEISEGWQVAGLAALANEGTISTDFDAITDENVKEKIIAFRKELKNKKAKPSFILANTDVYAAILGFAGSEFIPVKNDGVTSTGNAGMWYGMMVIEANALTTADAEYYNFGGDKVEVDLTEVDFIMGDYQAFSAINNFEMLRVIDSERRAGALAQVETNAAYRVTNADRIIVKYNTSPTA